MREIAPGIWCRQRRPQGLHPGAFGARTSYAVAVDKWRRAQGSLLAHYDIVVERPGERTVPWFARF